MRMKTVNTVFVLSQLMDFLGEVLAIMRYTRTHKYDESHIRVLKIWE